ncbi:MAG: multiple sugar transport system substrate-binding protein [Actinomycetota bacterium]|jgi:multiple sugar transport system substrate-binding protein|nr:multiple sugar transport system substrate-binding protein [Actinomycetota bacterium]MDQ1670857.1 multiple sugar transport system substrate-binding protein [Actinomycetota bacterium]
MSEHMATNGFSRRRFIELGFGGAAATALAACGGGKSAQDAATGNKSTAAFNGKYDGPAVTLSYWNGFTGGDGPFMKQLVNEFQQENPKITVKSNTVEWAQYYQRVPAAVTAGKGPDVGAMHLDQLATNAARKVIVPVDDVAKSLGLSESDFTPEVWQAGIYKGARYGIPLDVHSLGMYYNKDQFQKAGITEAPKDAASYEDALGKLKSANNNEPFWMPSKWPAHLMFLSLLWQFEGAPYAEDGSKATFDSDAGVQALTWMADVVKKGYSPKNVAQDSQYVAFKNSKLSVTWDGIWQINDLKASKLPFALAPVPVIGTTNAVWANSHNFYITKQATGDDNKLQASKVFIDWMSKKSAEWAGAGMVPARKSVRESAQVQETTQAPIAAEIAQMKFLPPVPGLGDVQAQTLEIAVADAILGKQAPAAALSSAASKATKLMEANQKKFGA